MFGIRSLLGSFFALLFPSFFLSSAYFCKWRDRDDEEDDDD